MRPIGNAYIAPGVVLYCRHATEDIMSGPKPSPLEKRFWSNVDRRSTTECWEWLRYRDPKGYGRIRLGRLGRNRRTEYAHRISWILAHGPIPSGSYILHQCDNPPCVNPSHLFLGTAADNLRDAATKGRRVFAFGTTNANGRKTHCPRGHLYDATNTYRDTLGRRNCRVCGRIRDRARVPRRRDHDRRPAGLVTDITEAAL